jgi:hypothetical protein
MNMNVFKIKFLLPAVLGMYLAACGGDGSSSSAPGAPTAVNASAGTTSGTASVSFTAPASSGSSAITGYTVTANPGGITATGTTSPITVTGLTPETAYTYSVVATNSVGSSAPATTGLLAFYNITETFTEPMCAYPTVFQGTFTYNTTTNTVSNLQGTLSEAMTGDQTNASSETYITLSNQLETQSVTGGTLVTTFKNTNTNTFATSYTSSGTTYTGDGWSAAGGVAVNSKYYGYGQTGATYENSGQNASATVFIPTSPTTALTSDQINQLAYADYNDGAKMGSVGMTGISSAVNSSAGTMGGYPQSQVITKL